MYFFLLGTIKLKTTFTLSFSMDPIATSMVKRDQDVLFTLVEPLNFGGLYYGERSNNIS